MAAGVLPLKQRIALATRRNQDIENEVNREAVIDGVKIAVTEFKNRYSDALHRPTEPCLTYNCHGLTFASRRTWIIGTDEIKKIIADDEYEEIITVSAQRQTPVFIMSGAPPPAAPATDTSMVMAGDIAVYFSADNDAEHSGLVVESVKGIPRILSKWGMAHEVVHKPWECPYDLPRITYYRIMR